MYGFEGVGLLGVEFSQCTNSFVLHKALLLAFDLYHQTPSLSYIHVENDRYAD